MPLADLKSKHSKKDLRVWSAKEEIRPLFKKYYDTRRHEPNNDFLYGLLCLIYDGINTIEELKSQMRLFFISSIKQVVVENDDTEEYLQIAKRKNLVKIKPNNSIILTKEGLKLVETSYLAILHGTYWMKLLFSPVTVILFSAICLVILSSMKILVGFQLASQGMFSEGIENLTDLIKIGIIIIIGMKFKRDKIASIIIILMMMFTGVTMIWSSFEAFFNLTPVTPTVQAYLIGFISILLNFGLLVLKGMVGRASGNLSLISDSKDSELNVRISFSVLIGLTFAIFKFYFVDSLVGLIIGILVLKEGIEILYELISKEKDFDITAIKVFADQIYDNRLTGYILGSIRRESISQSKLIKNFEEGLALGRLYYGGFSDFFYDDLGPRIAEKHLNKLLESKYLEILNDELVLTAKGIKAFYYAKMKEYRFRAKITRTGEEIRWHHLYYVLILIILILLIVFANDINSWLASL